MPSIANTQKIMRVDIVHACITNDLMEIQMTRCDQLQQVTILHLITEYNMIEALMFMVKEYTRKDRSPAQAGAVYPIC